MQREAFLSLFGYMEVDGNADRKTGSIAALECSNVAMLLRLLNTGLAVKLYFPLPSKTAKPQ